MSGRIWVVEKKGPSGWMLWTFYETRAIARRKQQLFGERTRVVQYERQGGAR